MKKSKSKTKTKAKANRLKKKINKRELSRQKRVKFFKKQILAIRKIKQSWNALTAREKLLFILPAILTVILVVVAINVMKSVKTTKFEGQPIRYYAKSEYRLDKNAELIRNDDNKTILVGKDVEEEVSSLPIYYEGTTKMLLPENMVYFVPRENCAKYRFNYCSELDIPNGSGNIILKNSNDETILDKGFVFDGTDIYIFLEDMKVELNNVEYSISAGSYVEANYYELIQIYDRRTGQFVMENTSGDVIAMAANGDYSISLIGDSVTLNDGTKFLLFTEPELLEPIK